MLKNLNKNLGQFKAVLYDLDGVLVDAVSIHFDALNKALGVFGYNISPEEHERKYNGLPTKVKLKMLEGLPGTLHPMVSDLKAKYTLEIIERNIKPSYDKLLMLSRLKKKGLKIACCSNAIVSSVNEMLKRSEIMEYFDLIIGNDSGYKPKPSPDMYIGAMLSLGVKPNECLIVEDSPVGIEAAKASGATVLEVSGVQDVNYSLFE